MSTFKAGDRVLVNTHSNFGIVPATVSGDVFIQTYGPNQRRAAVPLVQLSWALVEDVIPMPAGWDR